MPIALAERDQLDRWIIGELQLLVERVTEAYEHYDAPGATRPIEQFIDDLSNWYLRRSRRLFWKSEAGVDKIAAYQTLHTCLTTVAQLLAPAMLFLAERLHQDLVCTINDQAPVSVHLTDWPTADSASQNHPLKSLLTPSCTLLNQFYWCI